MNIFGWDGQKKPMRNNIKRRIENISGQEQNDEKWIVEEEGIKITKSILGWCGQKVKCLRKKIQKQEKQKTILRKIRKNKQKTMKKNMESVIGWQQEES